MTCKLANHSLIYSGWDLASSVGEAVRAALAERETKFALFQLIESVVVNGCQNDLFLRGFNQNQSIEFAYCCNITRLPY